MGSTNHNRRRRVAGQDLVAFNRGLTIPALEGRLWLTRRDHLAVKRMVATASVQAQRYFAAWDPEGVGVSIETAAYDLASLARHELVMARQGGAAARVEAVAKVLLGDWWTQWSVAQQRAGGDVVMRLLNGRQKEFTEESLDAQETLACLYHAGIALVVCDATGRPATFQRDTLLHAA